MKEAFVKWFFENLTYILSGIMYSIFEYKIGKNKNINGNSLLEVIENKFWGK